MAEAPARSGPTLVTTAATAQAIVTAGAAGTWTILRDIVACNEGAQLITVTLGIGTSAADTAGSHLLYRKQLPPNSDPWTWGGFLPLIGGSTPELLYAYCDQASSLTVTCGIVTGP